MLNFISPRENQGGREAHLLFQCYEKYLFETGKGIMASSVMLSCVSVAGGAQWVCDSPLHGLWEMCGSLFP